MSFVVDRQTIDDLNIFGRHGRNSIYALYNKTATRGGASLLEEMFRSPLDSAEKINSRSGIIRYCAEQKIDFPFRSDLFDAIEDYLSDNDLRSQLSNEDNTLKRKVNNMIGADSYFERIHRAVVSTIEFVNLFVDFVSLRQGEPVLAPLLEKAAPILDDSKIGWIGGERGRKRLSFAKTAEYDKILRFGFRDNLYRLLHDAYLIDVYTTLARVSNERGFAFAHATEGDEKLYRMEGIYHPQLSNAVANDFTIGSKNNVVFLTGANMAGKSTFMKTFCIAIYLAHSGFPVPARSMEFTVSHGMFTTINLSDNINTGYSHFYAEVMRIKKVAQEVKRSRDMIVVFDELFRGTNVKDAYDATLAVTEAFASNRNCLFVISTHILETVDELKKHCDNINYVYLPTVMENGIPRYTYKLERGISADRHGMIIIRNEKILDILASGTRDQQR